MRDDQQKLQATQKQGAKREQKDLEQRHQLKAPSRQGHARKESGQGVVRRRDGEADTAGR